MCKAGVHERGCNRVTGTCLSGISKVLSSDCVGFNIRDKGHPSLDKTNRDHSAGHLWRGATSRLQNCILEFHQALKENFSSNSPWCGQPRARRSRPPSQLLTSRPRDFTTTGSRTLLCFAICTRAGDGQKNGAGADSDGVRIDRLVLRLSADRLGVLCLRHIQIRHPARQEAGVAATLRAFPGTSGTLALRTRPRGTSHANQRLFAVLSTRMGSTRVMSSSPCRATHEFLIVSLSERKLYTMSSSDFSSSKTEQTLTRCWSLGSSTPSPSNCSSGPFCTFSTFTIQIMWKLYWDQQVQCQSLGKFPHPSITYDWFLLLLSVFYQSQKMTLHMNSLNRGLVRGPAEGVFLHTII